jgi:hypothetical protein
MASPLLTAQSSASADQVSDQFLECSPANSTLAARSPWDFGTSRWQLVDDATPFCRVYGRVRAGEAHAQFHVTDCRLGLPAGKTEDEAVLLVAQSRRYGINFIDTAPIYGTEAIVGKALKFVPRCEEPLADQPDLVLDLPLLPSRCRRARDRIECPRSLLHRLA